MRIEEVTAGVHAVAGDSVNWTLIEHEDGIALVDAGYPGDHGDVLASIRAIGHELADLSAILITHGHIDHMGGVPALLEQRAVPVYAAADEVGNVRRDRREQAAPGAVVANLWRPGALRWVVEIMGKGALRDRGIPTVQPLPDPGDLPAGLVPVMTPGHTGGHTAFLLPRHRVLLSGDTLITGHPLSRTRGPQLLPAFFDHDRSGLDAALDVLAALDADAVVPGHGPVHRGSPADAVRAVRDR